MTSPASNGASLDASRKGKAIELLVAATCILASDGALNVSTSFVDDEGVDLVFHRRARPATLAVQVKGRSMNTTPLRRGRFLSTVRGQTFAPRDDFYLLFVAVDTSRADIVWCWLVPSGQLAIRARPNARNRLRFLASMSETTSDQWRQYRVTKAELPGKVLAILDSLET